MWKRKFMKPIILTRSSIIFFLAIKDLNLKYYGKDEKEEELFIKLFCSGFTPNEKVDF